MFHVSVITCWITAIFILYLQKKKKIMFYDVVSYSTAVLDVGFKVSCKIKFRQGKFHISVRIGYPDTIDDIRLVLKLLPGSKVSLTTWNEWQNSPYSVSNYDINCHTHAQEIWCYLLGEGKNVTWGFHDELKDQWKLYFLDTWVPYLLWTTVTQDRILNPVQTLFHTVIRDMESLTCTVMMGPPFW